MSDSADVIELLPLALMLVPVAAVIAIMAAWRAKPASAVYATFRMLAQLLLVGYALVFIFTSARWWLVSAIVILMMVVSSWIALRPLETRSGCAVSGQPFLYQFEWSGGAGTGGRIGGTQ